MLGSQIHLLHTENVEIILFDGGKEAVLPYRPFVLRIGIVQRRHPEVVRAHTEIRAGHIFPATGSCLGHINSGLDRLTDQEVHHSLSLRAVFVLENPQGQLGIPGTLPLGKGEPVSLDLVRRLDFCSPGAVGDHVQIIS